MARVFTLSSVRGGKGSSLVRSLSALLTGAALLAGVADDAAAYSVKTTSRGELVHWDEATISYTIDPSVDRNVAGATNAVKSALDAWSGTVGAPELSAAARDESSPTKPGYDRKNGVFFVEGGYAPAGRALAITVLTYDNRSGTILDADVVFNGTYSFEVLGAGTDANLAASEHTTHLTTATDAIGHERELTTTTTHETVYDLHHVIAHEIGHSLGMNDEMQRADALMYRYSAPNDASLRQPASDDIEGLAELYSTKLDARGSGCGSATVAPKKPSRGASHAASFAALGLLVFLLLRARNDQRARIGFVAAAAAATIAFVPTLSGERGAGVAQASGARAALGHARAKVLSTSTAIEAGLFKTTYKLATTECRAASCPTSGYGVAWGGTIGDVTQEVGGYYAPSGGDDVDVSFAALPSALRPMSSPLAGRDAAERADVAVTVVTRAQ